MSNDQEYERKATEVLLSIEAAVLDLRKNITVLNTTHKMILDRVNKVYGYIDRLEKEIELENQLKNTDPSLPQQQSQQFSVPPVSIFDKGDGNQSEPMQVQA